MVIKFATHHTDGITEITFLLHFILTIPRLYLIKTFKYLSDTKSSIV